MLIMAKTVFVENKLFDMRPISLIWVTHQHHYIHKVSMNVVFDLYSRFVNTLTLNICSVLCISAGSCGSFVD